MSDYRDPATNGSFEQYLRCDLLAELSIGLNALAAVMMAFEPHALRAQSRPEQELQQLPRDPAAQFAFARYVADRSCAVAIKDAFSESVRWSRVRRKVPVARDMFNVEFRSLTSRTKLQISEIDGEAMVHGMSMVKALPRVAA